MKICPKCGNRYFSATAHVTQTWMMDANGNFAEAISNCDETTHTPDDEDLWTCTNCGYDAAGEEFNVPEELADPGIVEIREFYEKWKSDCSLDLDWESHTNAVSYLNSTWLKAHELCRKYSLPDNTSNLDYEYLSRFISNSDLDDDLKEVYISDIDKIFKGKLSVVMNVLIAYYVEKTNESVERFIQF